MDSEYMKSIKNLQQQIKAITVPLKIAQDRTKIVSDISLSISSTMKEYFNQITESLKAIQEVLSSSGISSKIDGNNVELLNKFYWVIPFEYKYENLNKLVKYKDRRKYEEYMLTYFNDNRVKRMFSRIIKQCNAKDKKVVLKQVKRAFFNKDYALCITNLVTFLDGLTLTLLTEDSEGQHLSYRAIEALLEYINECPINEFGYELYLKVRILNNFYVILYENEVNFKNNKKKNLSRHLNSHGIKYLNTKIDTLRLLNVICFCQEIIAETEMQEKFTKTKKDKYFKIKGRDET